MSDHVHEYKEAKLFRITKVHHDYKGAAGDMAFITKACACGKVIPLDYGPTKKMQQKFKKLGGVNGGDSNSASNGSLVSNSNLRSAL